MLFRSQSLVERLYSIKYSRLTSSIQMDVFRSYLQLIPLFVINPQTGIVYPEGNEKLQRTAEFLASYIKEATGITVRTTTEAARKNSIILAVDGSITNKRVGLNVLTYFLGLRNDIQISDFCFCRGTCGQPQYHPHSHSCPLHQLFFHSGKFIIARAKIQNPTLSASMP